MIVTKHLGQTLVTSPIFAKSKKASRQAVWKAIKTNRLPVILVGENKEIYIDTIQNKDFIFDEKIKRKKHQLPLKKTNETK